MSTFVFNFQQQFADDVESGKKRMTIRAMRKDGKLPKVGDTIKCFTGLRSKSSRLLFTGKCIRVRRIRFNLTSQALYFGGVRLQGSELEQLAYLDGFADFIAMLTWFREQHGRGEFVGFVTNWEPL